MLDAVLHHCPYWVLLASARRWNRTAPAISTTHPFRLFIFFLINKEGWNNRKKQSSSHIAQLQKGLFYFILKEGEDFPKTESQNNFCLMWTCQADSWKGFLCSTCEGCSCSSEEKGESLVFGDALLTLVPLHFSCSEILKSDPSSENVFLSTPFTANLWLNKLLALFLAPLPVWKATDVLAAACSLRR